MTYYPQPPGAWPPPIPPRAPSGGTALTAGVLALVLAAYCGYNTFWQVWFMIDCGIGCLGGIHALPAIVVPLSTLFLLVGAIMTFARVLAGPIMSAIGTFLLLAMHLLVFVVFGFHANVLTIAVLVLTVATLVMSLLPPTLAWTRSRKPAFPAYPPPMPYPPRY